MQCENIRYKSLRHSKNTVVNHKKIYTSSHTSNVCLEHLHHLVSLLPAPQVMEHTHKLPATHLQKISQVLKTLPRQRGSLPEF